MLARLAHRPLLVALLLGLAAQILFSVHLGRPVKANFDEVHYLPAARAQLEGTALLNPEHPMLGKTLIAAGMAVFGDNAIGWRAAATLAGTATVLGLFAFVGLLTGRMRPAVVAALLVMLNQTVFIQARIAMLDGFMAAFTLWGLAVLLWAMRSPPGKATVRWLLGSVLLGLAVGVKWTAAPYIVFAGLALLWIRFGDARRAGTASTSPVGAARRARIAFLGGTNQPHWPGLATIPALLLLGVASVLAYFLTFLPAFFLADGRVTLATLLPLQLDMYAAQTQVLAPHNYQSQWWQWLLMLRPIWYFYEVDSGAQRGVLLIGNPVAMWGGLIAVAACYLAWFRQRVSAPLAVALLWTFSVAIWALIPKSLGFYYYYHLSGIFICAAIAVALDHYARDRDFDLAFLGAAVVAFVYFYPILSAAPLPGEQAFNHWMWLDSWR